MRPTIYDKRLEQRIHVRLQEYQAEALDEICKASGMSRSQVLRIMLDEMSADPSTVIQTIGRKLENKNRLEEVG